MLILKKHSKWKPHITIDQLSGLLNSTFCNLFKVFLFKVHLGKKLENLMVLINSIHKRALQKEKNTR